MESAPASAGGPAGLACVARQSSWEPVGITLRPGASRDDLVLAARLLAAYLLPCCEQAIVRLHENLEFVRACGRAQPAADQVRQMREAEMADLRRALRRLARIRRDPARHARREIRRLASMLDRVPFERLDLTDGGLTASLRLFVLETPGLAPVAFEVHLPRPDHELAPVYIVPARDGSHDPVFFQGGCHGACRGEAEVMVEDCAERADLSGLVLVALAWARRNLW